MKIARYRHGNDIYYGSVLDDGTFRGLEFVVGGEVGKRAM